jgi:prepilin-type N-terminal cleavage/methylation domain-containing protein
MAMRRHFRAAHQFSFTLVELLVVIAIIAILAAVLLAAGNAAIKAALRVKSGVMASQIQIACMNYDGDYNYYPISTNTAAGTQVTYNTADTNDWEPLIYALCGNINPYNSTSQSPSVPNTRGNVYLTLNRSSMDNNGVPLNPIGPTTPSYFNISMDGAYSGILTNVPLFSPGAMSMGNLAGVGVYVYVNNNSLTGTSNVNWWTHSP